MPTPSPTRSLLIPLGGRQLSVSVRDQDALLDLVPTRPCAEEVETGSEPDAGREPFPLRVPARALVAALRVAWADEHDSRRFEPWRDGPARGRWYGDDQYDRYGYGGHGYERYGYDDLGDEDRRWYDELGDGDANGYHDPTAGPVRLPYRAARTLSAPRAGEPWEAYEHEIVREMWLAADPGLDKKVLLQQIADRVERGVGGITAKLRTVGCDPNRPGARWERGDGDGEDDATAGGSGEPRAVVVPLRRAGPPPS